MYVCIYVLSVCYCTHLSGKLLDVNFEVGHKSRYPLLVRDLGTKKATSSQQPTYSQLVCTHTTRLIVDWLAALYKTCTFHRELLWMATQIFLKKFTKNFSVKRLLYYKGRHPISSLFRGKPWCT